MTFGSISSSAAVYSLPLKQFDEDYTFTRLTGLFVNEETFAGVIRLYIGRAQSADNKRGQIISVPLVRSRFRLIC